MMESDQQVFKNAIGLFNDTFPPLMDGVSMTVFNYAYWLQKKAGNVCVITPKMPHSEDDNDFRVMRYASVSTLVRKPYRLGVPYVDAAFMSKLLFSHKTKFSIVHAHSPFSSGKLAMRTAHRQNIPFVATFHSKFRDDFKRLFKKDLIVDMILKEIIDFFESADEVWIPQASVEDTIREYGYKGKLVVVDNGTDFIIEEPIKPIKTAARQKLGVKVDEFMLLFVGQHIWEKNTRIIIEALDLLRDFPYKMFFVGMGYAANDMKAMIEEKNLTSKVKFVGSIYEREIMRDYYAAADLFLFPSIYDNAPLVVREAAALHTPSILARKSTSSEIIRDNIDGFLTDNDAESLSDKIKEVLTSPERIDIVGENASRTIARSWENVAEEVLDRYKQLILRKK
ncbi:MAG: glycosyltransferase [Paludibacteraceae bacterium]